MWPLSLFLLVFVVRQGLAAAQCNSFSGPSGTTECVKFKSYYQSQWATCTTDAYIRQKTHNKHACKDQSRTYCWYQCMLEMHNKGSGSVTIDCSCNSSPQTTISPTATLSSECYSPPGSKCNWFSTCLERKYPCKASSTAYAVKYAKFFCAVYEAHASAYSLQGQNWMNRARKCLQISLVPLLRPWAKPTCQDIRQKALDSHSQCFLNIEEQQKSICQLDCKEYFKIFWTIRESFFAGLDTAWESMRAMWNIGIDCGADSISKCFQKEIRSPGAMRISKIVISRVQTSSVPFPNGDARNRFADKVGSSIAKSLNWNTQFIGWLAFPVAESNLDSDSFDIILVLADKKALGVVHAVLLRVNFDYIFNKFASKIKQGTLPLITVDETSYWVKSLDLCSDKACITTTPLAFADRPNHDDKSTVTALLPESVVMYGATAAVIMLSYAAY